MASQHVTYILRDERILDNCLRDIRERAEKLDALWSVEIKPYKKKRSLAQNRLYWLWLGIIADELGYMMADDLHEELSEMFLPPDHYTAIDKSIKSRRMSTTKISVQEFTLYLNRIELWAGSEFNIRLPHPMDWYEAMGQ